MHLHNENRNNIEFNGTHVDCANLSFCHLPPPSLPIVVVAAVAQSSLSDVLFALDCQECATVTTIINNINYNIAFSACACAMRIVMRAIRKKFSIHRFLCMRCASFVFRERQSTLELALDTRKLHPLSNKC